MVALWEDPPVPISNRSKIEDKLLLSGICYGNDGFKGEGAPEPPVAIIGELAHAAVNAISAYKEPRAQLMAIGTESHPGVIFTDSLNRANVLKLRTRGQSLTQAIVVELLPDRHITIR